MAAAAAAAAAAAVTLAYIGIFSIPVVADRKPRPFVESSHII